MYTDMQIICMYRKIVGQIYVYFAQNLENLFVATIHRIHIESTEDQM